MWLAGLITGATSVFSGIISLILIYKNKWIVFIMPTRSMVCDQFKDGWHVFISTAAISLYTTSTTVILGIIAGPVAVGYYVAADKIRLAVQNCTSPIFQALYPRINAVMMSDKISAFKIIKKLLVFISIITFCLSLAVFFSSGFLINIAFGSAYYNSISVLKLLAWLPFIVSLSNVFGIQTLLVLGYKKIFSSILILSGVVNLVMLTVLSYLYKQNGAAISIVITEVFVTIVMCFFIVKLKIPLFSRIDK
ncbi:hypothetical protein OS42_46120 [Dickeya oryzae]